MKRNKTSRSLRGPLFGLKEFIQFVGCDKPTFYSKKKNYNITIQGQDENSRKV
jgi:hypothetical protein